MKDEYNRVNCNFYDQLEAYGVQNKRLAVIYKDENSKEITETIEIKTLETKEKAEYLITKSGLRIRLDKIVSLKVE